MEPRARLAGVRVLLVEDEFLIADELNRLLRENGAVVVGPFPNSASAMQALPSEQLDFAILDIALAGNAVYPLAEELRNRQTPFAFLTGYSNEDVRSDFARTPMLQKPAGGDRVIQLIAATLKSSQ